MSAQWFLIISLGLIFMAFLLLLADAPAWTYLPMAAAAGWMLPEVWRALP